MIDLLNALEVYIVAALVALVIFDILVYLRNISR